MVWRVGYSDGSGEEYIVADDRAIAAVRWGCSCCKDTSPLKPEERERAHLLAAAPKLLAVCRLLDADWSADMGGPDDRRARHLATVTLAIWRSARTAIAEADRAKAEAS